MYLHYVPSVIQRLFPQLTWHRSRKEKTIYLTFDDGPIPEVTPFILQELGKYGAKATFFCVGDNIRKHPDILQQLLDEGHQLGNHTFNHLNGLHTETERYLQNVQACREQLLQEGVPASGLRLFRPPYGRIRKSQLKKIRPGYEVIMWDVLTADFDQQLKPEVCLRKSLRYTRNGSIVVFHDNYKAWENLSYVLPRFLQHFSAKGYSFKTL